MSINLYDTALINKLQHWTGNTNITIVGPDETTRLFESIADNNKDKNISLPLISLKRSGGFTLLSTGKTPMSFDGATLDANNIKASQLNAIPISIPYQLDIYTRYLKECDEYVRNIVFNIINYPKLDVTIPYNNENRIHHSNIRLQPEINNTSDIPERLISGQFTRMTLNIDIDDAYLWDVRYRDVYSIDTNVTASDNNILDDLKDIRLL